MRLRKKEDAARFRTPRSGLAAVEFAVILPLLVTIVLGCVDFGRFAYSYIALTNAARAGAAYAVMNPYLMADQAAWMARIQQTAQDEMYQQTGYVAGSLTIQTNAFTDSNGLQRVQITAGYPFQMIVPWPGIPNNVILQTAVQMRAIR